MHGENLGFYDEFLSPVRLNHVLSEMLRVSPVVLQNVTLFGNTVVVAIIICSNEMILGSKKGPGSSVSGVLIRKGFRDTGTTGRDESEVSVVKGQQGWPVNLLEETRRPLPASGEAWSVPQWDFGFLSHPWKIVLPEALCCHLVDRTRCHTPALAPPGIPLPTPP